jgi:hypothetical protein
MNELKQKVQVDVSHYNFEDYADLDRWNSYWHQIAETLSFAPETVLIIGIGDNIVGNILTTFGIQVYTFDLDEKLHPDFVGNITEIDNVLNGKKFDLILCCQVLEHLPYDLFETILGKLKAIADNVIISLPYSAIKYKIEMKLPIIKNVRIPIYIHKFYNNYKFEGQHYWEIGNRGYTKRKVTKSVKKYFTVKKRFVVPHNMYHLFFILNKK